MNNIGDLIKRKNEINIKIKKLYEHIYNYNENIKQLNNDINDINKILNNLCNHELIIDHSYEDERTHFVCSICGIEI